jgi:hypothetical protein
MKCGGFSPFDFEHTKNRGKIIPKKTANSVGEHRIGNHNIFLYGLLMFFFSYSRDQLYPFTIIAEANSTAQHFVDFTEEEEDLVFRMHRLVGNRYTIFMCC